ncbi:MAG: hypothetical protein FK733_14655 [Asgard group archaeon]|nr:hypothetical protein [Asgard group archaeon]
MSSKKPKAKDTTKKPKEKSGTKEKASSTKKKPTKDTKAKETKTTIPKEWKDKEEVSELEKGKRRSLISALKRSISIKGPTPGSLKDPMNIVITLSPAKHLDIIDYIEETVAPGGRAEWVRDSIRLKMRIEKGIYGLNTGGPEGTQKASDESFQKVMGQFAEVMTKLMEDSRTQPATPQRVATTPERSRPPPPSVRASRSAPPPAVKKVETEKSEKEDELKPERPSLDDAMGAIIVVQ